MSAEKTAKPPAGPVSAGSRVPAEPKTEDEIDGFHKALSRLFAEQQKKALEFKMVFSEGIGQAASVMEQQSERIAQLLSANEGLARGMAVLEQQVAQHESQHSEMQLKIAALRERRDSLLERGKKFETDRNQLRAEVSRAVERSEAAIEQNANLQQELERLERGSDEVEREAERAEKRRDKLRSDVARLTQLRDEFVAQVGRLKDEKDELVDI